MPGTQRPSRRIFLRHAARLAVAGTVLPLTKPALANLPGARSLAFDHTHTGERLSLVFAVGHHYVPEALTTLNHFLRDHYSGEIGQIDPALFDLLFRIRQELDSEHSFEVISGYRCPTTNATLRRTRAGGVARNSLHMEGRAIDIRLPNVPLSDMRDAAKSVGVGGVGFYPRDKFVHVDTGKVRYW